MFKKDPQPKASANIKNSERRKLVENVCKLYGIPQDKLDKEAINKLVPSETKLASFKSIQGFSGSIYYDENETPIWFKTRDSQVYPSLFTVWRNPYVLPLIKTHPHVIEILEGGADLMLPGTIPPFNPRLVKGAIVGVVDTAHPTVIKGVGICKMDISSFDRVIGTTGVAVELLHTINDQLYKLNKLVDIDIPEEVDLATPIIPEEPQDDEDGADTQEQTDAQSIDKEEGEDDVDSLASEIAELTVEEIDNFFTRSLLQTIKTETIELPITASNFMASYIYKNLPVLDPSYCNIKKTSWKKTAKFLKAMDKQKYIQVKGKDEDLSIIKLMDNKLPILENFVTHRTMGSKTSKGNKDPTPSKKANELSIVQLYKPGNKSRMFFNKVDAPFSDLYTTVELRSLFEKYVKLKDLVNPNDKKTIRIDDDLKSCTNLGPQATPRDKVFKAFLTNCSPHFLVVKPGETKGEVYKGEPPKISIITETKIGRKVITRVSNFENYHIKPHVLAEELRIKCSGSSTIGQMVQNPKITEVTVQGPHGKLIMDLLKEKGVPTTFIEFENKAKSKKKRA
ncbi:uncharacterized protein CANTADRAFT_24458 [Suhomyces tanzawaensis NRRL Y-17324]|uniref:SUI1 domain-containing protein n=1 Tax=Suhomyces tanzawaensis NRRL Y-17324 TaxID=984487 RepID=A0A1E4SPX5_9ASCO|nr:uncharacterized protein CANTADRAFT_24458 [Suhomyces tanzawaensis NRRL Y-17324]ODV81556.1 hypothetical protein CANTADRAFT_24458 [Suhomyces tanzawaensis NRRL Y-17324]